MREPSVMQHLREDPLEWHRHGMTSPSEIDRIVQTKLSLGTAAEPTYADFFLVAA
ncbi:hypothetical protein [Curtobacterium sp. MCBD17_008]|uniref:hypothetical protein n=1 Tax=Curtobacterium sp. MCBD17_008 TaxID=2175656 RepID=UPI0015E8C3ED|nr:hypothetical protein [Curtobacterium sp. MCBD17_008]